MANEEGKKTCINCKFGVWKYDAFVCFRANMIKFVHHQALAVDTRTDSEVEQW